MLTIGMAHHNDFDGAYFTIQDIRKELIFNGREDLLNRIEFVVVENDPEGDHAVALKRFLQNNVTHSSPVQFITLTEGQGTSITRNLIIDRATGDFVLVMDCHVLLCPVVSVIEKLFDFMEVAGDDLYQGPLVQDAMKCVNTHFNDLWSSQMWGVWGSAWKCECGGLFSTINNEGELRYLSLVKQETITSCQKCGKEFPQLNFAGHNRKLEEKVYNQLGMKDDPPFEIFAQGLGLFFTKKSAWLGFNEYARGFGGEECYIHTKYRQHGRKTLCLSFLKWLHRFARPNGVKYPLTLNNKVRNYVLEFTELGLDLSPVREHFSYIDEKTWNSFVGEAKELYGV